MMKQLTQLSNELIDDQDEQKHTHSLMLHGDRTSEETMKESEMSIQQQHLNSLML